LVSLKSDQFVIGIISFGNFSWIYLFKTQFEFLVTETPMITVLSTFMSPYVQNHAKDIIFLKIQKKGLELMTGELK
jgi:hypothetical protein